jgi:hypothetical protein
MHGSLIPKEHHYSSVGCIMSLPVIEFIVALRNNDDISELNGRIDGRSIIGVIDDKVTKDLSSTFVKTKLQDRVLKNTHNMLSKEVQLVIKESKLYEVIKESDKLENTVNEPDERD